jgi:hypothetical protein
LLKKELQGPIKGIVKDFFKSPVSQVLTEAHSTQPLVGKFGTVRWYFKKHCIEEALEVV